MDESRIVNADNLADAVDEEGRNLTQQRMDAEGVGARPVDVDWEGEARGSAEAAPSPPAPPAEPEVTFEPDVPLVAEVNRSAAETGDRRRMVAFGAAVAAALGGLVAAVLRRRK